MSKALPLSHEGILYRKKLHFDPVFTYFEAVIASKGVKNKKGSNTTVEHCVEDVGCLLFYPLLRNVNWSGGYNIRTMILTHFN